MPMDRSLNNANRTWRIATKIVRTINYIMPNVLHVSRLQLGCCSYIRVRLGSREKTILG